MKKMKTMPDVKMLTDIEATLVLALFEYYDKREKGEDVNVGTLIRNFAEALLLREKVVNNVSTGDLGGYPSEEEIVALAEKACMLAVEMTRRNG